MAIKTLTVHTDINDLMNFMCHVSWLMIAMFILESEAKNCTIECEKADVLEKIGPIKFTCRTSEQCLNVTLEYLLNKNVTNLKVILPSFPLVGTSFSGLRTLRTLEIAWEYAGQDQILHANKNFFGSHVFGRLAKLETLRINIPTQTIEKSAFLYLNNLRELDLSDIGFFSTEKLAILYRGSRMQEKPLEVFRARRMSGVETAKDRVFLVKEIITLPNITSLKIVDVSYNRDIYLYPGVTQHLPNLELFNVTGNNLRYIYSPHEASCTIIELFLHMNLKNVDISRLGPLGKEIDYYAKNYTHSVIHCIFQPHCVCNVFKRFCGSYFHHGVNCSWLPNITYQDVHDNKPVAPGRYCDNYTRLPLPQHLIELRISGNMFRFTKSDWQQRTICLHAPNLRLFDVSYIKFTLGTNSTRIYGFENLTDLNCAYSGWGYFFLDQKFLHSMPKLEVLNMTGTTIGIYMANDTNGTIFRDSMGLRNLSLGASCITTIQANAFKALNNLEYLDLSSNGLSSIDFDVTAMISLKYLDLSHNDFVQLVEKTMKAFDWLVHFQGKVPNEGLELNMNDNAFVCGCSELKFLKWIKVTGVAFTNEVSYLCSYIGKSKMTMHSIDVTNLIERCYLPIIAGGSVGVLCMILFITSFLTYKYRWRVRLIMLKLTHFKTKDDSSEKFEYDGFVVYTDNDREWVHNTLIHELEHKRELKLCIHHRDFIPGHDIDAQIVRSVDSSRKTLLVLSRHFLESSWCQYEMNVARNKLQAEGKDVVLPVLLAELSPEELNENLSIKNLLREKTYLRWETSIDGQEYFWKKLTLGLRSSVKSRKERSDPVPNPVPTTEYTSFGSQNVMRVNYGSINA